LVFFKERVEEAEDGIELDTNCIRHLKNTVYGRIFYEWKKSQNIQEVHNNLHISGSLILFLIVLKHPLVG
jgi:hypothetical protein